MKISKHQWFPDSRPALVSLGLVMCLMNWPMTTAGAIPESISGGIQVNAVTGETGGESRSSLNQRYSLNWSKRLLPYVLARATLNYDRFGMEGTQIGNSWRQEIQPVAEIGWDHPYFTASISGRRRESSSQIKSATVIRNNVGFGLRSRITQLPILTMRYDHDEAYNKYDRSEREMYEERFQAGAIYTIANHTLNYSLTRQSTDVRSSNRQVEETGHLFRWDQSTDFLGRRVRLTTGYNFGHRRQHTRFEGDSTGVRAIPVTHALYAVDATPDFGALDTMRALADGNLDDPAFPTIDIGQGSADRNIGVDFGFARPLRALYIYTDGPSGTAVTWSLYVSNDNLTWVQAPVATDVRFNASFNRYEILFGKLEARYVKAVSGGLNDRFNVLVTEIEALEEELSGTDIRRTQTSHQASAALGIRLARTLRSTVDVLYRGEPASDFSDSRDQLFYGTSLRHTPSPRFRHALSFQAGQEQYHSEISDLSSATVTYTATASPLQTLEFTLSAVDQFAYEDDVKSNETRGALFRGTGAVFRQLDVALDVGCSRVDQPLTNSQFDSWTYQTSVSAGVIPALDVLSTFTYQSSSATDGSSLRIRRQVSTNVTCRVSSTILLRSTLGHSNDDSRTQTTQEYSGAWAMGNRMSWSALVNIRESSGTGRSERITINSNYKISTRTSLTMSYSGIQTDGGNETRTHAYQAGIRSGF